MLIRKVLILVFNLWKVLSFMEIVEGLSKGLEMGTGGGGSKKGINMTGS